jgi:hypothetical protein
MMKAQRDIVSFVLRFSQNFWQDAQGEPHVQWRGHIRHVQGDEEVRFTDFADAVAFIQHHMIQLTLDTLLGGSKMDQEKVSRESFRLWEQFASGYTNMMFETMERAIKQSEALRKMMNETVEQALKAWQFPVQPNQSQVIEKLDELQAQVRILTDKVESLEKALQNGNRAQKGARTKSAA